MPLLSGGTDWSNVIKRSVKNPITAASNTYRRYKQGGISYASTPYSTQIYREQNPNYYGNNRYYAVPKEGGWDFYKDEGGTPLLISQADWERESGLKAPDYTPVINISSWATDETPSGGFSVSRAGSSLAPNQPNYVDMSFDGEIRRYDLNNPNDRIRFFDDKVILLNQAKNKALADAGYIYDQNVAAIDQEIADIQKAARGYVEAYKKGIEDFTQDYELHTQN